MARTSRAGRPPKAGPRYISGRLKPNSDPRGTLVLAHRARQAVARGLLDPKWASELELLGPAFAGELTHAQVDAGHLVARIYGKYEKLKGIPRSTATPSYVRYIASDRLPLVVKAPDGTEGIMRLEDDAELERRTRRAMEQWERLQDILDELPFPPEIIHRCRKFLEQLCVDNQPLHSWQLQDMRDLLDHIGRAFGRRAARRSTSQALPSIAITARQPPRNQRARTTARRAPGARPQDPRTPHEHAIADREKHRQEKARRARA